MIDSKKWTTEQHVEARKEIDLYKKKLRSLIRDARMYHVSPRPDGVRWDGIQYWDPDRRQGVVYAFRGTIEGQKTYSYVLGGLEPAGRYALKFYDHSAPDRTVTGRELMTRGLKVTLPEPNSSEVIFIEGAVR